MACSSPGHLSFCWKAGAGSSLLRRRGTDEPRQVGAGSYCPENGYSRYHDPALQHLHCAGLPGRLGKASSPDVGAEQRDLLRVLLAPLLCILWSKSLLFCYYEIGAVPIWGMLLLSQSLL